MKPMSKRQVVAALGDSGKHEKGDARWSAGSI